MAQITDLNVSPYYDDFDEADNFHRVLFRPGFAIQARELTQLQSILQNQVERHGSHMFKEGSIVIPGQLSYSNDFPTLQLSSNFASEEIDPSQFFDSTNPVTITGATSGYANPELQPDSGNIVYLENRKPIQRDSDQTEDIKLIIEF